jgi:hypothetical protein
MQAMFIVAIIFSILAKGAIGAIAVLKLLKSARYYYIITISALGVLVLGDILAMIGIAATVAACGIIGCVFWLIGWPGFAVGVVLEFLQIGKPAAEKPADVTVIEPVQLQ